MTWVGVSANEARKSLKLKQAHNDLRWIGLALHQYHETYGCFSSPVVYDDTGKPMHSWRSLIQPQLAFTGVNDEGFAMQRFDEPWNNPHNLAAAKANRFNRQDYSFLAIVGPEAVWQEDGSRRVRDFKDGPPKTILIVGIKNIEVGWHEPCDLTFDGKKLRLERDGQKRRIDLSKFQWFALFADGRVSVMGEGMAETDIKALITTLPVIRSMGIDDRPLFRWPRRKCSGQFPRCLGRFLRAANGATDGNA
jgi:hypothetical protein